MTRLAPAGRSNMWTDLAVAAAAGRLGQSDNGEADEPFFSTVTPVWWGLKTFAKVGPTTSRFTLGVEECWVVLWKVGAQLGSGRLSVKKRRCSPTLTRRSARAEWAPAANCSITI